MQLLAIPYPSIDPVLIEFGPFAIRWYALSYIFGILVGWWYARRLVGNVWLWGAGGPPMSVRDIDDFVVWATIGIVLGGRIGYVLVYDFPRFAANPASIFALWEGGMSFHGGFLGTVIAMILFAWRRKIPVWSLIDVAAASTPFGLFFGRLANFINAELYGRVTDVPWGMVFPGGGDEPRHPSQLYEAFFEGIVLFLVLRWLTHRSGKLATPGFVSGAFAVVYGLGRTISEFFREPDIQIGYFAGGLTMGMLLSIPMVIAGAVWMVWSARRGPSPPRPVEAAK